MSEPGSGPPVGLRERKKARMRATIAAHAFRLFREQGYEATTVQQIIDEAEVSESTFFRYFPTKGDVVLTDDLDPVFVDAFLSQPPELAPIAALRASFRIVFAGLSEREQAEQRERTQLVVAVPELRAAMLDQYASAMRLLAEAVAERTGRRADDVAVRALAGAVVGVAVSVQLALVDDPDADIVELLDEALGHLEAGLRV